MDTEIKDFKYRFYQLRKEHYLNQLELSKILNASQASINMWESGKRMPSREKLEEIADYFNVDMDYLIGRQDVKRRIDLSNPEEKANELIMIMNHQTLFSKLEQFNNNDFKELEQFVNFIIYKKGN